MHHTHDVVSWNLEALPFSHDRGSSSIAPSTTRR